MNVIVFDIGGTWFRSGLYSKDQLIFFDKDKAINYKDNPSLTPDELQLKLCEFIIDKAHSIAQKNSDTKIKYVAISMGAALNGLNGFIYNSGPLWGPDSKEFDLAKCLMSRTDEFEFVIINDLTAALFANIGKFDTVYEKRIGLVTISSGIAYRVFDREKNAIPLDAITGLQGEIGHIPINFTLDGRKVDLNCDCGGKNHLNAFCSGRGITALLKYIQIHKLKFSNKLLQVSTDEEIFNTFIEAVKNKDRDGLELLAAITDSLAEMFVNIFVIDSEVEKIILTGGVVKSLDNAFIDSLNESINRIGMYQVSGRYEKYFKNKWIVSKDNDTDGMIGAAKYLINKLGDELSNEYVQWRVNESYPITYTIEKHPNLFIEGPINFLAEYDTSKSFLIFIDANVSQLYHEIIKRYFERFEINYKLVEFESSEASKTTEALIKALSEMVEFGLNRRSNPVIVIGGGVLMDIIGFACSIYRRRTPYIRIPTTLLGIVDAGIGVKTAVNFKSKKNGIGTYYAPLKVLLDRSFIRTQETRHVVNGIAEILKIAIVMDKRLFELLEEKGLSAIKDRFQKEEIYQQVIDIAIEGMLNELKPNLLENNLERKVDFGHTFSQEIEMQAGERMLHGEAVAIDMVLSSIIAYIQGKLSEIELKRIINLTEKLGLPVNDIVCDLSLIKDSIDAAIKHRDGLLRMPVPVAIGESVFINEISDTELSQSIAYIKNYERRLHK